MGVSTVRELSERVVRPPGAVRRRSWVLVLVGVSTVRELKGRIKKNESIKDLGCPQPESEPTTIQAQPSRTYLCPPPSSPCLARSN